MSHIRRNDVVTAEFSSKHPPIKYKTHSDGIFKYEALHLGSKQIRVLSIEHSTDNDAPVRTCLSHVDLADKPAFKALSYT
jgi:hypothetical protein